VTLRPLLIEVPHLPFVVTAINRTHTTMRPYSVAPSRKTPGASGLEVLKGRQVFREGVFWKTVHAYYNDPAAPCEGGFFYFSVPGVKTPGSVLLPLRGMKLILVAIFSLFNWLT
jgi:hypothetical protein